MATLKKRINISLPKEVEKILSMLAKRDNVPQATKALHLIETALELEEDFALSKIADERYKNRSKFFSHKDAWK